MAVVKSLKIRKGDEVFVTAGREKGKKGKVIRVMPKQHRIVIDGVNMRKKHVRAKRAGEKGQMVDVPSPLHVSSVQMVCGGCGKLTRIGHEGRGHAKKRICKKCKATIK